MGGPDGGSCTLYWAPSTIPDAGNGCFTAVDLAEDVYLPSLDTIIPVFPDCPLIDLEALLGIFPGPDKDEESDQDKDEDEIEAVDYDYDYGYDEEEAEDYDYDYDYSRYDHIKAMLTDCYPDPGGANDWAWKDYSWSGSSENLWTDLVKDRTEVDVHSMGIGSLCNALPGANDLAQDTVDDEEETEGGGVGPGAGAFFSDQGRTRYYTESPLAAGAELFLDYGTTYYEARGYRGPGETLTGRRSRSLEYLEQHGQCLDNVLPGPSHIGPHAGKGAIASRSIRRDSVIAPLPVIYIIDGSNFDLYDVKVDVSNEAGEHPTSTLRTVPMGKQIMLNYCLAHPDSSLLLSPYGPFYYNHASVPNARLRWAPAGRLGHRAELLDLSVEKLAEVPGRKSGLIIEVVATRDIARGEEVTLDYGREWAAAWEDHVKNWLNYVANSTEGASSAGERGDRDTVFHPHSFRHAVRAPDEIYPEMWRNLKTKVGGEECNAKDSPETTKSVSKAGGGESSDGITR